MSRLSKLLDDLRMPLQGFFASGESVLRDILRTLDSALILTNFPKTVQPATTEAPQNETLIHVFVYYRKGFNPSHRDSTKSEKIPLTQNTSGNE